MIRLTRKSAFTPVRPQFHGQTAGTCARWPPQSAAERKVCGREQSTGMPPLTERPRARVGPLYKQKSTRLASPWSAMARERPWCRPPPTTITSQVFTPAL